jgi:hypothetical protein
MYKKLKSQGLEILAVNPGDEKEVIEKYYKSGGFTFPTIMNGKNDNDVIKNYRVVGYPTNYLIGPDGKVLKAFLGYQEDALKQALEKLGLKG